MTPMTDDDIIGALEDNGIAWYRNPCDFMNVYAQPDSRYDDSDCVSGMTMDELFDWIWKTV